MLYRIMYIINNKICMYVRCHFNQLWKFSFGRSCFVWLECNMSIIYCTIQVTFKFLTTYMQMLFLGSFWSTIIRNKVYSKIYYLIEKIFFCKVNSEIYLLLKSIKSYFAKIIFSYTGLYQSRNVQCEKRSTYLSRN